MFCPRKLKYKFIQKTLNTARTLFKAPNQTICHINKHLLCNRDIYSDKHGLPRYLITRVSEQFILHTINIRWAVPHQALCASARICHDIWNTWYSLSRPNIVDSAMLKLECVHNTAACTKIKFVTCQKPSNCVKRVTGRGI